MSPSTGPDLRLHADLRSVSAAAAEGVVDLVESALSRSERFSVGLSGENTPRQFYHLVATAYRASAPRNRVEVF